MKASEYSCYSREYVQRLLRSVLAKYNPEFANLVHILPGFGETGAALCKCKDVAKILFIGSPATGRRVMASCVENLTPCILELGGKDAFIVMDDAEMDWAIQIAVRAAFINLGQNCISAERFFVHKSVMEK